MLNEFSFSPMENSLARPSLMRCPSLGGRKDASLIPNRSGPLPRQPRPIPFRRKSGPRIFTRRDASEALEESYTDEFLRPPRSKFNLQRPLEKLGKPADGYVLAASHLRLSPPCMSAFRKSNDDIPGWNLVTELSVLTETSLQCPICLSSPIVPRMERCGHIYCGPCAVQYVRYENDGNSKKCAVCSWIINIQDMKRVNIVYVEALKVGSNLDMSLVHRDNPASNLAEESHNQVLQCPQLPEFDFVVELSWKDLHQAHSDELSLLKNLRNECLSSGDTELLPHISYLSEQLTDELKKFGDNDTLPGTSDSVASKSSHVFYQASDGRLIFLDGLMWKCLLSEFGSSAAMPNHLNVSVTAIRNQKMSLAASKRWRHLNHIPVGRWFTLVDIDLKALVSDWVLEKFAGPLRDRSLERNRRLLEDIQLTQQKEAAENQLPTLPVGFVLSGHAELSDAPIQPFHQSDFVPLCNSPEDDHRMRFSSSFAEVTKSGARSVVDRNRVANFSRDAAIIRKTFDPTAEVWPSLSSSTKPSTSLQPSTSGQNSRVAVPRSKKQRKKPTETI